MCQFLTTKPYVDIILSTLWNCIKLIAIGEVLRSISDINSLELFNTVALLGGNSTNLARRLDLSRKQYYSKMSRLIKSGLVKKYHGDFCLTTFGIILYEVIEELRIKSDMSLTNANSLSQKLVDIC